MTMHPVEKPQPERGKFRYLRAPTPIHFPTSDVVPETELHALLTALLFESLKAEYGRVATVGSDHFVYWDATDPSLCLAPDVMLRHGTREGLIDSWKVWERGAPELCVEVVSDSDRPQSEWAKKLRRYHQLGVLELVRFDSEAHGAGRLRVWDRVDGDLVERDMKTPGASASAVLSGFWSVADDAELGVALRLTRDEAGRDPVLTDRERARAQSARATAVAERLRAERDRLEAKLRAAGIDPDDD